tara:strand:+ start:1235 stop:1396 length:162 start_codon:yes stop_codon:yes gene_type:complete
MKEFKTHTIEMNNRLHELEPEYQVILIRVINQLASYTGDYQKNMVYKIQNILD